MLISLRGGGAQKQMSILRMLLLKKMSLLVLNLVNFNVTVVAKLVPETSSPHA